MKIQFIRFFLSFVFLFFVISDVVFSQRIQVDNVPQSNANLFLRKLTLLEASDYLIPVGLNHKTHFAYYSVRNPRLTTTILARKNRTDYFSEEGLENITIHVNGEFFREYDCA